MFERLEDRYPKDRVKEMTTLIHVVRMRQNALRDCYENGFAAGEETGRLEDHQNKVTEIAQLEHEYPGLRSYVTERIRIRSLK